MRVTVDWDDEAHTIIRYTYAEGWTWADYEVAIKTAYKITQAVNPPMLDVIADFSDASLAPKNLIANFQKSLNSPYTIHFGVTILVTPNLFMTRMIEMYRKINKQGSKRIRLTKTIDEARAIIAKIRQDRQITSEDNTL